MTIEEALKSFIETNVSAAGNGYPHEVPTDATLPAWSYHTIRDEELLSHAGQTGFASARIQLDFFAEETVSKSDYAVTKDTATAVRDVLDGYKGMMSSVQVYFCKVELNDEWADTYKLPVQRFDVLLNYQR